MLEWSDEDLDDHEFPDDDSRDSDDEVDTVVCSECGTEIYEDAPRCPSCGNYVTSDTSIRGTWVGWTAAGLLTLLAIGLLSLLRS
jgi:hypothetical protein